MKKILALITIICSLHITYADQINPVGSVFNAIHAAQSGNIERFRNIVDIDKVKTFKVHSYSENELLELLRNIPINEVKFKDRMASKMVHMTKPINLKFEIQSIERLDIHPRIIYKIIGVHPYKYIKKERHKQAFF